MLYGKRVETTLGQPQPLKGLSQFLVEHEQCGAGFDVSHPSGLGSGKVSMTCRGCGATYEYATATIEFEREIEFEPVTVRRPPQAPMTPPPPPPPPRAPEPTAGAGAALAGAIVTDPDGTPPAIEDGTPPPPREPADSDGKPGDGGNAKKKRSRDRAIAAGLLVLAAAAMAFAVYRVTHQSEESSAPPAQAPPTAVAPPKEAAPSKPQSSTKAPDQPTAKATPKQAQSQPPTPLPGEKQIKEARFELIVPTSWTKKAADGGSLFAPAGDSPVSVQVFYENDPAMSKDTMASQTAGFLRSRDPSATVGSPQDRSVAGDPAFELHAVGDAGTQVALGVLAGKYRYLVIENADPGTSPTLRREADRVLTTFRPR